MSLVDVLPELPWTFLGKMNCQRPPELIITVNSEAMALVGEFVKLKVVLKKNVNEDDARVTCNTRLSWIADPTKGY